MELLKIYNKVDTILNKLDFHAIFSGFHKYRFALYDSNQICIDGRLIPYQEDFIGNTSISYDDGYIAIWNMEMDPIEDAELLAYSIVHEMFHCYQKDSNESRYPSDLVLLSYPDDIDNFTKKYNENRHLAEAYENQDVEEFKRFHSLRNIRLSKYPDMVSQELRAETLEGLAEYAGLTALKSINESKFQKVAESYIAKLKAEDGMLFDVRRISYYSGAIYFLCLKQFSGSIQCDFESLQTVYEQNLRCFEYEGELEILPYDFIARSYSELLKKKQDTASRHISNSEFIECDAYICGYDPMNMFRIGDIIFCSHFVCLNVDGRVEMLKSAVALKAKNGSANEIKGYYINKA